VILQVSASRVARFTGVSHQHPADMFIKVQLLKKKKQRREDDEKGK
jgi:hypothetical protein